MSLEVKADMAAAAASTIALTVTLALLLTADGALGYVNEWDQPFLFACHSGQVLTSLNSYHSNGAEDRRWDFGCSSAPLDASPTSCHWTDYVNDWDQPITFMCSANHIISGVQSYHTNDREDRRYKFKCCKDSAYKAHSCSMTSYINSWDGELIYSVPSHNVLIGVVSVHSNSREDRRFRFIVCGYESNN